jgi:hypothetical protein
MSRRYIVPALCAFAGLATAALVAGPTTPPGGPITSTYKTLTEIEPRIAVQALPGDSAAQYIISAPGSYYLTTNIAGVAGKVAIRIAAANVTLDLSGMSISTAGAAGVLVTPGFKFNIEIRNGVVTGCAGAGIDAASAAGARFHDLRLHANAAAGLIAGPHCVIDGCEAVGNGGQGLQGFDRAVISNCLANDNAGVGFLFGELSEVTHCSSTYNAAGFDVQSNSTLTGCNAGRNDTFGFRLHNNHTVERCTAAHNLSEGFYCDEANTLTSCTSNENGGHGFRIDHSSNISGCTARKNLGDGIVGTQACTIVGNTCNNNGWGTATAAGIHVTQSYNRIEGNTLHANDTAIVADGGSSTIVRNLLTANTADMVLAPNNAAAVLLLATSNFSSSESWANLKR